MALDIYTRTLLFLLCCIPIRIFLVILPKILLDLNPIYLYYFSFILLAISLGFLNLYFNNDRLDAFESGGLTWWSDYRLVHGGLYLIAFIYAYQMKKMTFIPLLFDVIFGILLFVNNRIN
jgi:hypothetical protein